MLPNFLHICQFQTLKNMKKNYKKIYSSTEKTWEEYYLQMRTEEFVEDTKFIWGK